MTVPRRMDQKNDAAGKIRLQVFISRSGFCSRRKALSLIQEGAVIVNGRPVAEPSFPVGWEDVILVQGRKVVFNPYQYVMLHKPAGYVTTKSDPFAAKTVFDLLPPDLRHLNPAGRLDKDTEGLLLFSNDGKIIQRLTHPRYNADKTYIVTIDAPLKTADRARLEKGVLLDDKETAPARIKDIRPAGPGTAFELTIHEGRKRQIRRMLSEVGYTVVSLKRIRQGPLFLGTLARGQYRSLDTAEITKLRKL